MMGVGPAGRWFMWPKERGRRMNVRMRGGRRVVYGRVARRKDCEVHRLALLRGSRDGRLNDGWSNLRRTCDFPTAALRPSSYKILAPRITPPSSS